MTQKKVIVAGHICVDITPVFQGEKVNRLDELLQPGKLVHTAGVEVSTGGAVANTGLAMKFLGADVKLMGKISDDEFGNIILQIMERHGYDGKKDMIITKECGTSYSVVLAVPGIDRIFIHCTGPNETFCSDDVKLDALQEASLFHFGYPPLLKRMYENDGEETVKLMKKVHDLGVATSLDLAAVDPASEAGKVDWKKFLARVLPYVDIFVPSIEELCYMLDQERYEEWTARAKGGDITLCLDPEKDIRPLAELAMEMGAGIVLIKCGEPGFYFQTADRAALEKIGSKLELDTELWADRRSFEPSFIPEKVLSATGAGDTCIAAFLTSILQGRAPEECLTFAAATGASCVESYTALGGLRTFEEIEQKIAAGWERRTEKLLMKTE